MLFQYVPTFEISIHTPHAGSDMTAVKRYADECISIHTPHAGSDTEPNVTRALIRFQSTLPMRGVTYYGPLPSHTSQFQSTLPMRGVTRLLNLTRLCWQFQSTLPMRGVTITGAPSARAFPRFQSTLPMRGVTMIPNPFGIFLASISIHTPHAGSDRSL